MMNRKSGKTKNADWKENHAKIHSAISRLSPVFGFDYDSQSWRSPEKKLMLAVIEQALIDKHNWNQVMMRQPSGEERKLINEAESYFDGLIWHAEISGVESDYVRRVIKESGL